jgi:hypothetical protein
MNHTFAGPARSILAVFFLAVIAGGPICAVCGLIISSANIRAIDLVIATVKLF